MTDGKSQQRCFGAGLSDTGCVRAGNEDRICVNNRSKIYIVADGMGGAAGGEVAAQIVVDHLPELFRRALRLKRPLEDQRFQARVQESLNAVNDLIFRQGREIGLSGMGTTAIAAIFRHDKMLMAHIGDSRCYLWRKDKLMLLSKDHTVAQELVDQGKLGQGDMAEHPDHHLLTNVVGEPECVLADIRVVNVQPGDRFLLCSDGLSNMLSEEKIAELMPGRSVKTVCRRLVSEAKKAGGEDNISAVVVENQMLV